MGTGKDRYFIFDNFMIRKKRDIQELMNPGSIWQQKGDQQRLGYLEELLKEFPEMIKKNV